MKKTINIVCAANDRYAPMCGIMLTSLFENNRDCHIEVYLLTSGFNNKNTKKMNHLVEQGKYDGCVHICMVDKKRLEICPLPDSRWTREVYYKFLIPEYIPSNVDLVLWLDCDMLINGSLLPLFETDMDNVALAGVDDSSICKPDGLKEICERLDYPAEYGHINAGLLLINLDYWRKHHVEESLFKYAVDYPERVIIDEDIFHAILYNKKKFLPGKYNVQDMILLKQNYTETYKEIFLSDRPVVVHYTYKPWNWYLSDFPFRAQWVTARKKSLWSSWENPKPLKVRLRTKLVMLIKRLIRTEPHLYVDDWKVWA